MGLFKKKKESTNGCTKANIIDEYFTELIGYTKKQIIDIVVEIETLDITKIEDPETFMDNIDELQGLEDFVRKLNNMVNDIYYQKLSELQSGEEISPRYYNYNSVLGSIVYYLVEINAYLISRVPIHFETYDWIKAYNNNKELPFWSEAVS